MAKLKYKGKETDIVIDNRTLLAFELAGGSFSDFDDKPISASIKLACCALKLEGDPLDHANDLPNLNTLSTVMRKAIEESGFGDEELGNEETS